MTGQEFTTESLKSILDTLKEYNIKDVPFKLVIKALSGYKLEKIDVNDTKDKKLIEDLKKDIKECISKVKRDGGIISKRINEVGNKMEQPVVDAINESKSSLSAERPKTSSGKQKSAGYPDTLIKDSFDRQTYLEVKIYTSGKEDSSLRTFYLSPSDDFKVTQNARHLLAAFEISEINSSDNPSNRFIPTDFKLVDLAGLYCSVKFEIQSNNKRLYSKGIIL